MTKLGFFTLFLSLFITRCTSKNIFVINSNPKENEGGNNSSQLVSVVVLFRHGDRSPTSSYPNDPYYDLSYWPEGFGQLLNKGKERQYELGEWFRHRYNTFLPEKYSPNDIRVLSTDVDRTLMSAAANLAGLYPPTATEIWNEDLLWEPIPIHTIPQEEDEILVMSRDCPKYNKLEEEFLSSEIFKNFTTDNAEFLEYISNHSGWNDTTIRNVETLYSNVYIYRMHNSSYVPSWVSGLDKEKFTYLASLGYSLSTFTDDMKRLKAGPFFNYLTNHFDDVVQNVSGTPKFLMLSGHDTTIGAVLNSMGAYDNWPPEFVATVIWELYSSENGTFYINLLYKRNSTNEPENLTVTGCTFNCAYENFKTSLSPIIVNTTTWLDECLVSNSRQFRFSWFLFLIISLLFVIV